MFGTLVIQLPAGHTGGALVVRHKSETKVFDFEDDCDTYNSDDEIKQAADKKIDLSYSRLQLHHQLECNNRTPTVKGHTANFELFSYGGLIILSGY